MAEDEINELNGLSRDEKFIAELEKRSADYKSCKVNGVAWEDAKNKYSLHQNRGLKMIFQVELHPLVKPVLKGAIMQAVIQ